MVLARIVWEFVSTLGAIPVTIVGFVLLLGVGGTKWGFITISLAIIAVCVMIVRAIFKKPKPAHESSRYDMTLRVLFSLPFAFSALVMLIAAIFRLFTTP